MSFTSAPQFAVDLWATVNAIAIPVDGRNFLAKFPVLAVPSAFRTLVPGIVAAARYLENGAHDSHRKFRLMIEHEAEDQFGSLEKMAMAFFKMSRSIFSRSFSRLSWRIISASDVICPVPGNAS